MDSVETKSHGRVNLIGEHTDYNGGFVLPICIPQFTKASLTKRHDFLVEGMSRNFGGVPERYTLGEEKKRGSWIDYVQGVTFVLKREGCSLSGFNLLVDSTVPWGSGLSSSAALEVSILKGLNELFDLNLSPVRIAQLGQMVENDFVGARVGIMDQMVTSLGTDGEALFIDTRDLSYQPIPLPLDDIELLVIDSGVRHSNSGGDYNQRRAECEKACELLGVKQLRDLTVDDLPRVETLPEPFSRRARHVISENARVLDAVAALKRKDFETLGSLFVQSHASMRDDYAVSIPEIDLLVELCLKQAPVYGARLTGGGFGGSIVALVRKGLAKEVGAIVSREYAQKTAKTASVLVPG
jgi:galactokinase